MGRPALDIIGLTFGRLTVLHRTMPNKYKNQANFLCRCACGNLHEVVGSVLKRGGALSCGCLVRDGTHGLTYHPLYNTWIAMIDRCYDPANPSYANYGGRGIAVCDEWRDNPAGLQRFIYDMGTRPKGTSVDRIDGNGHYHKENCRWATPKQQAMNARTTHVISYGGRTGSLTDWSKWTGLGLTTIRGRLAAGQTLESALEPIKRNWRRPSKITYTTDQTARRPSSET